MTLCFLICLPACPKCCPCLAHAWLRSCITSMTHVGHVHMQPWQQVIPQCQQLLLLSNMDLLAVVCGLAGSSGAVWLASHQICSWLLRVFRCVRKVASTL